MSETVKRGIREREALECIARRGSARSNQVAADLGITTDHAGHVCRRLRDQGKLVSCVVEVPGVTGRQRQEEYRIAAGPLAPFKPLPPAAPRPPRPGEAETRTDPGTVPTYEVREIPAEDVAAAPPPSEPIPDGHELGPAAGIRIGPAKVQSKSANSAGPSAALGTDFACALWSDGQLSLLIDGEGLTLTAEQTRILSRYLERLTPEAG